MPKAVPTDFQNLHLEMWKLARIEGDDSGVYEVEGDSVESLTRQRNETIAHEHSTQNMHAHHSLRHIISEVCYTSMVDL